MLTDVPASAILAITNGGEWAEHMEVHVKKRKCVGPCPWRQRSSSRNRCTRIVQRPGITPKPPPLKQALFALSRFQPTVTVVFEACSTGLVNAGGN